MYSKIHTIWTEEKEEDNEDDEEEEEEEAEDEKLMLLHVSKAKTTPDTKKNGLIHTSTWEKYSHKCW